MKNCRFFLILWIALASCRQVAKEVEAPVIADSVFKSLEPAELLSRLFNSADISGKTVRWKPAASEAFDFELSYDGKFHTELDTVFFFTDLQATACAAVIFRTYDFYDSISKGGSHYDGSPVGVALFCKQGDSWKMYRFNKNIEKLGYYHGAEKRYEGELSLRTCAAGWNCLYLKQEAAGQMGSANGHESFYSLDRLQLSGALNKPLSQVFFNDYLDYTTEYDVACPAGKQGKQAEEAVITDRVTEIIRDIKFLKKKNGYDIIRLKVSTSLKTQAHLQSDYSGSEVSTGEKTKIITYRYNEMQYRYVEVK